jgi:hypothetical protein
MTDRSLWFKSVDDNLKSQPKQFWKYVSEIWKTNTGLIYLQISDILINKPCNIAEAFSKYFQSVCSNICSGIFSSINQCMESLSLAPTSNSYV